MNWPARLQKQSLEREGQGLHRELREASGGGVRFRLDGREVVSFASNDYLGLSQHPAVIAGAEAALREFGASAGASPLVCGHKAIHKKLEERLAAFKISERALVFPSGFQVGAAAFSALGGENTAVILDRLSHASLIDGARTHTDRVRTFLHNDVRSLRKQCESENGNDIIVVIESLYSMDGDVAPVEEISELCENSGALLLVDEAHATGVLGENGRGALEALSKKNGALPAHIVALGTLSKALGSQGGFVCASNEIIDAIIDAGRPYLFSTALAPAAAGAALAALDVIDREPGRRGKLLRLSREFREKLTRKSIPTIAGVSPVIPILIGDEAKAAGVSQKLLDAGLFVPAIRFPTVKRGEARLRVSMSAEHSENDIDELIEKLNEAFHSSA